MCAYTHLDKPRTQNKSLHSIYHEPLSHLSNILSKPSVVFLFYKSCIFEDNKCIKKYPSIKDVKLWGEDTNTGLNSESRDGPSPVNGIRTASESPFFGCSPPCEDGLFMHN